LPTVLTLWVVILCYRFIQGNISIYINRGLVWLIMYVSGDHQDITREVLNKFWVTGAGSLAGFFIALIIVLAVGAILASVMGRALWRVVERFIMSTPFLKQVYPYIKQITDFLFLPETKKKMFSKVVLVEYPSKGIWSVGFVTGSGVKKLVDEKEKEFLTVFIATSPSPFTGFTIIVAKNDVIEADMTVEEAVKFLISGGVVAPGSEQKPQFVGSAL